jgi:crotonobetainyl-CoA:carnitine CoA-transferase CaiB-like acyl-CoA transferase
MAANGEVRAGERPLDGLRVLELGQLMAGPLAGTFLAYFGADVIKVEPPRGGDPVRTWRVLDEGTSLWWRSLGRNKRCITLDLRDARGQALARRLASSSDVLIENFRPGTLEGWGLGPDVLRADNPDLVYVRVSGFGQDGPYAQRRGFASVCEAVGGLRHVTGEPGRPPVRANLSLGDSLAAFQAVIGALLGLLRRERGRGGGQVVDVSILESVLNVMEAAVSEYDRCGVVREPSGTTITGVVPTDAYPCADGRRVVIGANADSMFRRLMEAAGRADLAADERLATNVGRVAHREEIDRAIAAWTATRPCGDIVRILARAGVPAGPIQSAREIVADPHVRARGQLEEVEVGGRPLLLPALGPRLQETPGRTEFAGGELGSHTDEVLGGLLGLDAGAIAALRAEGVV